MIWFLVGLRGHLASASEALANVAFGAGIAAVALLAITPAPDLGGWVWSDQANRHLEPGAAEALKAIANGFYFTAAVVLAGVYLAVGLVSIRHRVFPRWVGGISLLLALVATIPMVGVVTLLIGFPLWTIIICVMLWRDSLGGSPPVVTYRQALRGDFLTHVARVGTLLRDEKGPASRAPSRGRAVQSSYATRTRSSLRAKTLPLVILGSLGMSLSSFSSRIQVATSFVDSLACSGVSKRPSQVKMPLPTSTK